jgi:rRNA-processing protein EBP2
MAKGGKLKAALDRQKGVDYAKEHQKKLQKQAAHKKKHTISADQALQNDIVEKWAGSDEDSDDDGGVKLNQNGTNGATVEESVRYMTNTTWKQCANLWQFDLALIDETSESEDDEDDEDEDIQNGGTVAQNATEDDEDEEDEDEEEDDDIPFSDIASLDSEERGDAVPYQRLTINNHSALNTSLSRIAVPKKSISFIVLQSVTSSTPTVIEDVDDDLNRELQFYAQSLGAVKEAKRKLKAEGTPFARPNDYFAEMVKSEEHMGRVRQRLVDDAAGKKAATDARKQRDLKKFGKAVQVAKQQERDKLKRDTLDQINILKRSMFAI